MNTKLGYYTCNGITFDSKIAACIYSVQHGNPKVSWTFNTYEFGKHNWLHEPELTLDQLYDARAKQLRETYDYLILSYSGGSDSHNILMSFVRQGLHIDELVVNTMDKARAKFIDLNPANTASTNSGAEHALQCLPRLAEIQPHITKTKITVFDLSDYLFDSFDKAGDASWVLSKREGLNPANATRYNYLHFDEVRKQFDKDKKIALIVGVEKPRTFIRNGEFIMRFADRAANIVSAADYIKDYTNSAVELFYWSPDMVPMMIKQGHVIKNWLDATPSMQHLWDESEMRYNPVAFDRHRLVHERLLRTLLYTTWDNTWYQADKSTRDWTSEFDEWFSDGYSDTRAYQVWKEGIDYVSTTLASFVNPRKLINGAADSLDIHFKDYPMGMMKRLSPELKIKLYNQLTNK